MIAKTKKKRKAKFKSVFQKLGENEKKETKNENQIRFSMSRVDEKRKMEWKSNSVLQGG